MQVHLNGYAVGANFATELANTSPQVWVKEGDMLPDAAALRTLIAEHALVLEALRTGPDIAEADVAAVRALRDDVRSLLESPADRALVGGVRDLLARTPHRVDVVPGTGDTWQWVATTPPGASVASELALLVACGLLETVRVLGTTRFRHCASSTCNGRFVDTSRGGRRRYCMPELCGNREHVANHRSRLRER